ncbi:MAG: DNA methyltransferase [Pseudomonadota bacterium]
MSEPLDIESFITRWQENTGGAERANFPLFLQELCGIIDVETPEPAGTDTENNAYVFERAVTFREGGDRTGHGRIDLYKKGCFVLEAKQSRWKDGKKAIPGQADIFSAETDAKAASRADRKWDVLMMNARRQAEDYAKALPAADGWPPFILVCDVGFCIEVYSDFTGQGKNYRQFPDRRNFRIFLDDLRKPEVRAQLKAIWEEPKSLDPTAKAVKASREIAKRLAEVSKSLEAKKHDPEEVAAFLMRCLFTMFAEDMELLPKSSFTDLLERCAKAPEKFAPMVEQLWAAMDKGNEFAYGIEAKVRQFNGNLFKNSKVFALDREELGELLEAARKDWTEVDPSIFGTLLEQALSPGDRSKLGAHYTPRAYVERLVIATIMEPLQDDWRAVRNTAESLSLQGRKEAAVELVRAFHEKLYNTRVLDPACGTGNFLYVSLELIKRLEGDVLEALVNLGGQEALQGLDRHEVDPHQFLGLELNHRARHIAELVLWIGFLQWHKRNKGALPGDPVLRDYGNIQQGDAVLTWDGYPVPTIVDGEETLPNARRPDWPEAEFIVGNPPFIGGKDIRRHLGDGYVETLWRVHAHMNDSADFVMYWWDRAAEILGRKKTVLRRFGFVTTNSITQVFQRRVMERHLNAKAPVSIVMAVADHPWTKATKDSAAVRIAMTVVKAGAHEGVLYDVTREAALETDEPVVDTETVEGKINSDLSVGVDLSQLVQLKANEGLGYRGMQLIGSGFIVTPEEAKHLGLGKREGLENHIREYRNGRDLAATPRGVMVIDLFGLEEAEVRQRFPEVYQHLLQTVKPERDQNRRESYKRNWWVFGEPRKDLRPALANLPRYVATVETAKHRIFQFLDAEILPDNRLVCMALSDACSLGVLSSKQHVVWALETGGTLEDRPIYTKSKGFDPFPFPDPDEATRAEIGALAEELDAHRKRGQAAHGVTLTQMYNVLEKLRSGEELDDKDEDIHDKALVTTLKHLHDRLDKAVARAYGWEADLSEQEVLANLVALNKERAAEEAKGHVRWLRPDYQIPKFGSAKEKVQLESDLGGADASQTGGKRVSKPAFPKGDLEQTVAVTLVLARSGAGLSAAQIARQYKDPKKVEPKVAFTLRALARMGELSSNDGGTTFALKRAA